MTSHTVGVLLDALHCADDAHSFHELEIGHPDPDWIQWYAEHMAGTLREGGYRLISIAANGSDISP
jgi:hypothetical protein